ncbi:autoinducer 2-binding periplasmic protein LuxP [Desulfococcaceae bacterium HSG7]|nr:autoinducer 2-binding periplasmic protein LuxP [Desulfococcaceae bacterium HSG7]
MKTAFFFVAIICFSVIGSVQLQAADKYMTVREFNKIHPEQVTLAKEFTSIVQKQGYPIDPKVQKQPVKITFIYPGNQISDYWRRSIDSFKKRMDEINLRYEVFEYFSKPAVDYRVQAKQMKTALKKDPDYLVFTLDARKHRQFIERIITKGRPKLILQNITTPLRAWEGKQPFLYDGFDHATGSEILADYYLERTKGEGHYAVLYHSQGYVSAMRGDTFIAYMKKHSKLILADSYYTDGNREKSKKAALEILKENPDVKFLYACSTDIALGTIDALRQTGKIGKIMVNGWGGGSSELAAITKGELDFTVMRMNDDNGVAMAEAIRFDVEGRSGKVPTVYSGDFALVKKGISQYELGKLKIRAFRYSGE